MFKAWFNNELNSHRVGLEAPVEYAMEDNVQNDDHILSDINTLPGSLLCLI